jgi:hypothetical protein
MDDEMNDWDDDFDGAPSVHTIVAVRQEPDFVEWNCPTCGRHVRVSHAGGLDIINPGDRDALHRGGVGVVLDTPASTRRTPPPETIH